MPDPTAISVNGGTVHATLLPPQRLGGEGTQPCATVLLCGGFPVEAVEAQEFVAALRDAMRDAGLAVATFLPRLDAINEGAMTRARSEDVVDDAAAVLDWLSAQTAVDARRVGVLGHSTGAVVAACLAGRSTSIASLCLVSPASTQTLGDWIARALPESDARTPLQDSVAALHPVDDAAAHDRPTLILHGAADRDEPVETSFLYVDRLQDKSHRVTHVLVARGDHSFSALPPRAVCVDQVTAFFAAAPALAEAT